jgi:hypothetical protein
VIPDLDSESHRSQAFAFAWNRLIAIDVPASVEVPCDVCFGHFTSLAFVPLPVGLKLQRIKEFPFARSVWVSIQVHVSVEVFGSWASQSEVFVNQIARGSQAGASRSARIDHSLLSEGHRLIVFWRVQPDELTSQLFRPDCHWCYCRPAGMK